MTHEQKSYPKPKVKFTVFMAGVANQTADVNFSRARVLSSGVQESMNDHLITLLFLSK